MSSFVDNPFAALLAVGVLLLVGLVVAVWMLAGLFNARSLVRRELGAYFLSPIAYVVLVVLLIITGWRFTQVLDKLTTNGPGGVEYPMQMMFSVLPSTPDKLVYRELLSGLAFWLFYLLIPPLLTMRLFAEERASGTLEPLMTAPLRDWQVVLSKYAACLTFYLLMWVPTLAYLPILLDMKWPIVEPVFTLYSIAFVAGLVAVAVAIVLAFLPGGTGLRLTGLILFLVGAVAAGVGGWYHYHTDNPHIFTIPIGGDMDPMPVVTTYLGLLLAGAMFLALGLLVSSLVRNQLVAALVSLILCMAFLVVGVVWQPEAASENIVFRTLAMFSVPIHLHQDFSRGLIDTRHLTLYGSVAIFSLFLTVRSLESRRWR